MTHYNLALTDREGNTHTYRIETDGTAKGLLRSLNPDNPTGSVALFERHPNSTVRPGGPGTYGHVDLIWNGPIPHTEKERT